MRPKVILVLEEIDVSRDNGAGINERGFVRSVADEPDVLCLLPAPRFKDNYFDPRHQYVFGHYGVGWRYLPHVAHVCWRVLGLRRRVQIVAIAVRLGMAPLIPLLLSRWLRVPLFLKTHDGRKMYEAVPWRSLVFGRGRWNRQMLRVRLQYALLGKQYLQTVQRAAVIDCPSATCRDVVLAETGVPPDRVVVVPNGANVDFYRPHETQRIRSRLGIPAGTCMIGYVGALGGEARFVGVLVDALIALKSEESMVGLIVGDGLERTEMERRVKEAGASERVCFPGFVPNREIPEYMSAMDIAADLTAVAFSLNGKTVYGSYSQKIAQYLACGVPVLAWDLPDTRFLKENDIGFLVPLHDREGMLQTLGEALKEDKAAREARRRRAREYAVKHFSYKGLASTRLRLWRDVVHRSEQEGADGGLSVVGPAAQETDMRQR